MVDGRIALLRHALATLAYRGGKALTGAPAGFGSFRVGGTTRTPSQILGHISDLLDWAVALADGKKAWHDSPPLAWEQERARFFAAIEALDTRLASEAPLACPPEKLFQEPISDALTHIGQIGMLRRLASAAQGENVAVAEAEGGAAGPGPGKPKFEFE